MWIQVRTMDGKRSEQVDGLSKLTRVEDLRKLIHKIFEIEATRQRLFFGGKQMEDGYTLFDYDVMHNATIQLLERLRPQDLKDNSSGKLIKENSLMEIKVNGHNENGHDDESTDEGESFSDEHKSEKVMQNGVHDDALPSQLSKGLYKVKDVVDVRDPKSGSWFEAAVTGVSASRGNHDDKENLPSGGAKDFGSIVYDAKYDDYEETVSVESDAIRPRARKLLEWGEIQLLDEVMVNYNLDEPKHRGFWYDAVVLDKIEKRKSKELIVKLKLGQDRFVSPCTIIFVDEVFVIEKIGQPESCSLTSQEAVQRVSSAEAACGECGGNPHRKCKECGCHVCGEKKSLELTLMCDECNLPFHTFCLSPPLDRVPDDDEWYCPLCRRDRNEVVHAGEKLKTNKKKEKMKSFNSESNRDWGKGMACVGRSKICTIVPPNHVGPVPGVPVGSLWKFRVQVSESGVHRPHVAGIHGSAGEGAVSIVLAGGYEDDEDNGDEFFYTGSGGRDLSGNKRTAEQSSDQLLTKSNLAIAKTCHAKVDAKNGAEAADWRKSRPIRVVRNWKGSKHSDFAPAEGNRYDGLYKVVKYWPEKGKSGFRVWRYLLRRDDPEPAPWTKKGKKVVAEMGLIMQFPDGYLEAQEKKEKGGGGKEENDKKRGLSDEGGETPKKRRKTAVYEIPAKARKWIDEDAANRKVWDEALASAADGQKIFYEKLQDLFACVCCQDLVFQPVTTSCKHNMCKGCLQRSFRAEVFTCPVCRFELGKDYNAQVNSRLRQALCLIFPGYENGR